MMLRKKTNRNRKKKIAIVVCVLVLLVAGACGLYMWHRHERDIKTKLTANKPIAIPSTVNYGPPTAAEKQESIDSKNAIVQQQQSQSSSSSSSSPKSVTPLITRVTQSGSTVSIAAYVSGVVESTGTCNLQATQSGSTTITQSVSAFENATTTNCTVFSVPRSQFGAGGSWSFTVTYSSPDAQGSSQALTQTIQ